MQTIFQVAQSSAFCILLNWLLQVSWYHCSTACEMAVFHLCTNLDLFEDWLEMYMQCNMKPSCSLLRWAATASTERAGTMDSWGSPMYGETIFRTSASGMEVFLPHFICMHEKGVENLRSKWFDSLLARKFFLLPLENNNFLYIYILYMHIYKKNLTFLWLVHRRLKLSGK